jgi:SAGA-associated factor 73
MAAFPSGEPRKQKLELVICKHCKRNIMKLHAKEHITGCLKSKQEKARKKKEARDATARAKEKAEKGGDDKDDDLSDSEIKVDSKPNGSGARKSTSKTSNNNNNDESTKKSKKRKADAEEDKSEPKKKKNKKDEPKPKPVPKPKGPVDVEKQCGVVLPNGAQCARSLTCKSHSMGNKRAVPGRSLPYDMLLQAYQKKNQARQQSMSIRPPNSSLTPRFPNANNPPNRSRPIRKRTRSLRLRPRRPHQPQRRPHRLRLGTRRRHDISRPQLQPSLPTLGACL